MPLIQNIAVSDHSRLGVWEITEPLAELSALARLSDEEAARYKAYRSVSRRSEWLAVRALLNVILEKKFQISYQSNGSPFLNDTHEHLSVSHTDGYAAILLNHRFSTGIDIQIIEPKLRRIRGRFLSATEQANYEAHNENLDFLHVIWGAKEALYKVYGNPEIFFKEHLHIHPFTLQQRGEITGEIRFSPKMEAFTIHYEKLENTMLVYITESLN